jgi:hypothetical protein
MQQQKNNIYSMNTEIIRQQGFDKLVSVFIPSIHKDYDTYTICLIFQQMFGTVCRIDRVANTTSNPDFQSVFVYYYENNYYNVKREPLVNNRVYPGKYTNKRSLFNRQIQLQPAEFFQDTAIRSHIKPTEFWVVLPNKTMFPDTTLTLDEIRLRLETMRANLMREELEDQDEVYILAENCDYLQELFYAENTPGCLYLDTTINIHQLAQNVKLMIERYEERQERKFRFELEGGTTVFVEGIPAEFKEPEMWECFSKQSGLIAVKVCKFPKTKESMECGYAYFGTEADAETAIKEIAEFKMAIVV